MITILNCSYEAFAYIETDQGLYRVTHDGIVYKRQDEEWVRMAIGRQISQKDYVAIRFCGLDTIFAKN